MDTSRHLDENNKIPESEEVIEIDSVTIELENQDQPDKPTILEQIKRTAHQKLSESKHSVECYAPNFKKVGEVANITSEALIVAGKGKLKTLKGKTCDESQQRIEWAKQLISPGVTSLGQSAIDTASAFKGLPLEFFELMKEMPKIAKRMRKAGVRHKDGVFRSETDAMKLFNKIPGADKLHSNQENILKFLDARDGSHIKPRQQGGGISADNIVWELKEGNRARAANLMTPEEQIKIAFQNGAESLTRNSKVILRMSAKAAGTAALIQALVTALSYTLDLQRGDITRKEFAEKIALSAASAGLATPVFVILFIAVTAMCPAVVPLLSAPLVVTAFNGLLGIGIVTPIVQSLARHTKAGGFGDEVKTQYEGSIAKGKETIEDKAREIELWWQSFLENEQSLSEEDNVSSEAV